MRELTLEQRERLARLCEVSDQQVPCQDDIRSLLDVYEQQRAELERLKGLVIALMNDADPTRAQKAEAEVKRLKKYINQVAWAIGSPKDADRLHEVLPLVLASYRARAEKAALRGKGEK